MNEFLRFLHLIAVVIWVGGMTFAHFCLRPAAMATLPTPQRLPLMAAALGRFFALTAGALVLLWASGAALFAQAAGNAVAQPSRIAMAALGALMTALYLVIALSLHPRMRAALEAGEMMKAGAALDGIRRRVKLNIVLGYLTIAMATLGELLN